MMTAEQARRFAQVYKKDKIASELKKIQKHIEMSAKEGLVRINVGPSICNENIQILKNLGYSIILDNDGFWWVSWDEGDRSND